MKSQIKKELRKATIEASQIEGSFSTLRAAAVEATNLTGALNGSAPSNFIRFRINGSDKAFSDASLCSRSNVNPSHFRG